MASDEYGNTYFTFNVYFRPGEISPALLEVLSSGKTEGSAVEGFFELSTAQESTQLLAVDQANSTFCEGNYVDGNWVRTNPKCEDRIVYKTVKSPSPYVTVRVDPVSRGLETAAVAKRSK